MWKLRTSRFRTTVGALALLGAVLNVWVLTLHITSTALASLRADGMDIVICHQGGVISIADFGSENPAPSSKKHCPICSGLATLHFGILHEPDLSIARGIVPVTTAIGIVAARIGDRLPQQTLNRGPPAFV